MKNYKTGMVPSPRDERDYRFNRYNSVHELPEKYERGIVRLKDQGRLGSCVGFASSYAKDEQESRNHPGRRYETSPLFVYHECKKRDGIPHVEGTYIRTANKVLKDTGVCLEPIYPYSDDKPMRPIPPGAYEQAKDYKIKHYVAVNTVQEIKQAIYDHGYVVGGIMVLSNFLEPEIHNGKAFVAFPNMFILGGHAVSFIGYDDTLTHTYADGKTYTGFLKLVNSWYSERDGEWWGVDGTAWVPYEILYRDISRDTPGLRFLLEAWAWQDEITPVEPAKLIEMWVGNDEAMVDGQKVKLDQPPIIEPTTSRTLTPLKQTCDLLGVDVVWDGAERKITIDNRIVMYIGRDDVLVDGKTVTIDQPPMVDPDSWRTLVPLSFLAKVMEYEVDWEPVNRKITIRR